MESVVFTAIVRQILNSFAFAGRDVPANDIVCALAHNIIRYCDGLEEKHVEELFFIARKERAIPEIPDICKAWEQIGTGVNQLRLANAPVVVRRVAMAVWNNEELVFEDPAMGALCLNLGMGSQFGFPSEAKLESDRTIQNAYKAALLSGRKVYRITGFGKRKNSTVKVPGGEKYKGPRLSIEQPKPALLPPAVSP